MSAYVDYRIAAPDPGSPERVEPRYYAVLEARSDDRQLFLDACGRDARRVLDSPAGSGSLSCAVRLAEPTSDDQELILQVRIYQRTGAQRSVTIASSPPISVWRAGAIFSPLERELMPRCNDRTDRDERERAAVIVCRG